MSEGQVSTTDTVAGVESLVGWCVPGFVEAATARRLPGAYRGERFWHGRATVERHRHWVVQIPCRLDGMAAVTVGFDGAWAWFSRPDDAAVAATSLNDVQAAFDAAWGRAG